MLIFFGGAPVTASAASNNSGVRWMNESPVRARHVAGPVPDMVGFAADEALVMSGELRAPLGPEGALSLWLALPEPYRTGTEAKTWRQPLLEVGEGFLLEFTASASTAMLSAAWLDPETRKRDREVRVILPEWPGPGWHHVAVTWAVERGAFNVWLDGTPYLLELGAGERWTLPRGREVAMTVDRFAVAGLRVWTKLPSADELRANVGPDHTGGFDALLGLADNGPAPLQQLRGDLLYARDLVKEEEMEDWVPEGPAIVSHSDQGVRLRSRRPTGPEGHLVYWCPEVFPDRFWAEWEVELRSEKGLGIVFFAARGRDGHDLFDPALPTREGVFLRYTQGSIDAYHISYFARTPGSARRVSNLRRNRGAFLLANGPVGVAEAAIGEFHRVILVKDGERIHMAVDGRTIIDYIDDGKRAGPVLGEGRIGLRQMQWTDARYRNFRVYALSGSSG